MGESLYTVKYFCHFGITFFTSKNSYTPVYPRYQFRLQITHFFFFSFPSLRFLFPCIVHCFLSDAQKTFLFPTLSIPPPNYAFLFFSFPSLCFSFLASSTTCSPVPRRLSFFPRRQSHPQITCSIFLVSFHAFLFPCLVHCFLSGTQKSFLFPRYQSCPKSHIPFFSFPSLRFSFFASSTAFSPAPRKLFFFHCFSPSCA